MSGRQLPVVLPGLLLCPSCGNGLAYASSPYPPDFYMAATCGRCDRLWELKLSSVPAVEVGVPGR